MAPKKTGSHKNVDADNATQAAQQFVSELDLKTLCPGKIFDIIFIAPEDEDSLDLLQEIAFLCQEYEDVAFTTFVHYDEVIQYFRDYVETDLPPPFPAHIRVLFSRAHEILQECGTLPSNVMAQLTKLKLIDVMYKNYLKEQSIQQKKIKLENDLRLLTKECVKRTKTAPVVPKKDGSKKSEIKSVGLSEQNLFGCSNSNDEQQLVVCDDITNHVWLYIFYGFRDIETFRLLTSSFNIPISAVIKVNISLTDRWLVANPCKGESSHATNETDCATVVKIGSTRNTREHLVTTQSTSTNADNENVILVNQDCVDTVFESSESDSSITDIYGAFLGGLYDSFDGPHRLESLENTILMHFHSGGDNNKRLLEQLLYVAKNIPYLKLKHIHYIRHITLNEIRRQYYCLPAYCLNTYTKLVESLPSQLVNEFVILISLLEEVDIRLEEGSKTQSSLEKLFADETENSSLNIEKKSRNPFDLELVQQNDKESIHNKKSRFIHETNFDPCYVKKKSAIVQGVVTDMLKNINSLQILKNYFEPYDIFHKHDKDPSTVTDDNIDTATFLHLTHLLLFSLFEHPTKKLINSAELEGDIFENIELYNSYELFKASQIEIDNYENYNENMYDTAIGTYRWQEKLSSDALIKEVAKAENTYLYADKSYCSETNSYLLLFSDCVDEFGINMELFEETLSTPVCLRDFCKYTLVEKHEWLHDNKPPEYTRKVKKLEECPGFNKIVALNLFPEYRHLLENDAVADLEDEHEEETEQESDIDFSDVLAELKTYPRNDKLFTEFNKITPEVSAFDLGTAYVAVKGARTTFLSHDDVKIIVDNTRFVHEEPHCSVNLSCRNNQLIVHSHRYFLTNPFSCHVNLSDGTIVTFLLQEEETGESKKTKRRSDTEKSPEEELINDSNNIEETTVDENDKQVDESTDILEQIKAICINKEHFENITNMEIPPMDSNCDLDELLMTLQNIKNNTFNIYKIISNLKYLKLNSDIKIPLTNLLRRLLPVKHVEQPTVIKRYMPTETLAPMKKPPSVDFQITMPNNLFVSSYLSEQIKNPVVEIKQEFFRNETLVTKTEEFRLFSRKGYILIKRTDGSIVIMHTNGDQVYFEIPNSDDETIKSSNLKRCRCFDADDYKKMVNKMLGNKDTSYFVSRRADKHSKKGYVINKNIREALEAFQVPYKKLSLLKFDGYKTCIEGNKIVKKRVYHVTCERDFNTEEMYFERSDGFHSLYDRHSKLTVVYPDGTKMISTAYVEPYLVDGFVFVTVEILYHHPDYADVAYTLDHSVSVKYKHFAITRNQENQVILDIDADINIIFERESMVFKKTCNDCKERYQCEFNLKPFAKKYIDLTERFVYAEDSYDKQFHVNFGGECRRNSQFINDAFNRGDCNHVDQRVYKRLFVIHDNYTGNQFWTSNMIETERKLFTNDRDSSINEVLRDDQKVLVKFLKHIFYPYPEQLLLSKYIKEPQLEMAFTTFRLVEEMVSFGELSEWFDSLIYFLTGRNVQFTSLLERIKTITEKATKQESRLFRKKQIIVEEPKVCKQIRMTMQDKTEKWKTQLEHFWALVRSKNIPCYFHSEFCKVSKNK